MSQPNEQRQHVRAPIELKVEYKKLNTFFADFTKNISKGGTFIKTEKPLPVGTEFIFKLTLPSRNEPFELKGVVVWTNSATEKQRPEYDENGMGIRFIFATPDQRTDFEKQVEKLMVDSLGQHLYNKLIKRSTSEPSPF